MPCFFGMSLKYTAMQLKLFSGKVSKSLRVGMRKRAVKSISSGTHNPISGWDLWSDGTDGEKEMALLFLDIRNFTPMVEGYQAHNVIHIVKKLFTSFQAIIQAHHGRIIETTGDGFYAAFGFDRHVKDAANDAVICGTAILRNLDIRNDSFFESSHKIEVGIGIHAGKVATGSIQLGQENHTVVMGYAVNIASRIQAATKELNNNFLISSTVFQLLNSPPTNKPCVHVNLKGVKNSFPLHLIGKRYYDDCLIQFSEPLRH